MIISAVFKFHPLRAKEYPYPADIHGFLYRTVLNTRVGDLNHKLNKTPFSLKENSFIRESYQTRVVFFDDVFFSALLSRLTLPQVIKLGGNEWELSKIIVHPDEYPLAGITKYETLIERKVSEINRLRFEATTFRNGDEYLPLPVPELILKSLAHKWNDFSPYPIHLPDLPNIFSMLAKKLLITSLKISDERYFISPKISIKGFNGQVELRNEHDNKHFRHIVNTLISFAPYSGVGWKCAYGMGQVKSEKETNVVRSR